MMPLWNSSSSSRLDSVETAAAAAADAEVASKRQLLDMLLPALAGVALLLPVQDLYGLLQVRLSVSRVKSRRCKSTAAAILLWHALQPSTFVSCLRWCHSLYIFSYLCCHTVNHVDYACWSQP
jgi:hypothetical protein